MRVAISFILAGVLAAFGPTAVLGQDLEHTSLADSVQALTHDLAAAWENLDADEYLGFYASDLVFYIEGDRVVRPEFDSIVRASTEALQSSTFEILNPEVHVLGPDAAMISFGLRELMVDSSGQSIDLRGALTLVWSRRDEGWQIVLAHESLPSAE